MIDVYYSSMSMRHRALELFKILTKAMSVFVLSALQELFKLYHLQRVIS
jgi:hypothetical protein